MADYVIACLLAAGLFLLAVFSYRAARSETTTPPLPGPSFREYLPGGDAYALNRTPWKLGQTLTKLCEKYGSVCEIWMLFRHGVVLSNPKDMVQVLASSDALVGREAAVMRAFRRVSKVTVFTADTKEHARIIRAVSLNFGMAHLRDFHGVAAAAVGELCSVLADVARGGEQQPQRQGLTTTTTTTIMPTATTAGTTGMGVALGDGVFDAARVVGATTLRVVAETGFATPLPLDERLEMAGLIADFLNDMMSDFVVHPIRGVLELLRLRGAAAERKRRLDARCRAIVQRRRVAAGQIKDSQPDLLDAFLHLDEDLNATTGHVLAFAIAGTHTSAQIVAWALYELCLQPELAREVEREVDGVAAAASAASAAAATATTAGDNASVEKEEEEVVQTQDAEADEGIANVGGVPPFSFDDVRHRLPLVKAVWREALRLHPPAGVIGRKALRDISLKATGYRVPAGTSIYLLPRGAHASDSYWEEARAFRPQRWLGRSPIPTPGCYLPFGAGARSCAGAFLADHQGVLILAALFTKFRFRLACPPERIVSRTEFFEAPRFSSMGDGNLDMGMPIHVSLRRKKK